MRLNFPTFLTVLRLIAAPGVAVMFLYFARPWADWLALILFSVAAVTDYFDGYLARLWKQESKLGAMLDPIADKAMVIIALLVITGFSGNSTRWLILPAALIIFREIFVSGLREFLGNATVTLKVTVFAKWKTTVQLFAIAVLFSSGIIEHHMLARTQGMDEFTVYQILIGELEDPIGLTTLHWWWNKIWIAGIALLWVATVLTLITGWDYFRKAIPHLKDAQ